MKKIDYVEEIKKSAKDIDFDEATRRLFEEYVDFSKDWAKKLYDVIQTNPYKNFYRANIDGELYLENYVDYIYAGNKTLGFGESLHRRFIKVNKKAKLETIVAANLTCNVVDSAIIENSANFVKQLFNLIQAIGAGFMEGYPKNHEKFHILVETSSGWVLHVSETKRNKGYYMPLFYRFVDYNSMVYNKKIKCINKEEKIKELTNKSEKVKKLYNHLKSFFNDIDFIYAILVYLDTEDKVDLYNLCLEKNESWQNHEYMNNILDYVKAAFYMYEHDCPKYAKFICDYIDKFNKTKLGKNLYKSLLKVTGNRNSTYCSICHIKTEEEKQEVIDFINSVKGNYALSQAYCEVIQAKRYYRNGNTNDAIEIMDEVLDFWAEDYKPFQELKDKMQKGEKID